MSDTEDGKRSGSLQSNELPVEDGRTPLLSRATMDASSDAGSSSGTQKSKSPKACHECGKEGHGWRNCPDRSPGSAPKCSKCGKRGHIAAQCRSGGRSSTKELSVALKDAIDKEGAKDSTIKELRAELAEKKNEAYEKAQREAKELIMRDCDYVDRVVEEAEGTEFVDRVFVAPHHAVMASAGVAGTLFLGANTANGVFLEAGLWGIPSFLLATGMALLGEMIRPKSIPATVTRVASLACAGTVWFTAAAKRGVLGNAIFSAVACAGVGIATYATLRCKPYYTFTATIEEAHAEETEQHGPDSDLPRDNRPDANNLLELTHRNPGFAVASFTTRWCGFTMARWNRRVVVSLEKFAQVVSPANQEVDEPDSTMWRRVKAACRTIHRVNDDRYEAIDGELISFNTAVLCYTALRQAKEDAHFYAFYLGLIDVGGPKDQDHV